MPATDASSWWTDLKLAVGMLTRVPVGRLRPAGPAELARVARVLPLVGALIGLLGGGAYAAAAALGLPAPAAALVAVAATVLATGAFHEDGLADVADGFGGAFERARKLEIMRDSAVGVYGALALVFSVGLRAAALAAIAEPGAALLALVAAHALARATLPAVMARLPLARPDGLAAGVAAIEPTHAWVALGLGAAIALLTLGLGAGLVAIVLGGLAALGVALLARTQIGGYSGDVLGAVEQGAEVAALLAAAAAL